MKLDLLLMRFILLLVAMGTLFFIGIDSGAIPELLEKDTSYISEAIIALFVFGMGLCTYRVLECSRALNRIDLQASCGVPKAQDQFENWCQRRWGPIDITARLLFRLGLMGTVYGFIFALDLDINSLTSSSTAGLEIGGVLKAAHIALVTTLVGVSTNIALVVCLRMLEGGYQTMYARHVSA